MVDTSNTTNQQVTFQTPAIQVGNQVRDGDEFILITRSRQSEDYKVWSSGDPQQTEQMYRNASSTLQNLRETTT